MLLQDALPLPLALALHSIIIHRSHLSFILSMRYLAPARALPVLLPSLLLALLPALVSPLQLLLTRPTTCLGFEAENDGDRLMFTYHHNPNVGTANMLVYDGAGVLLAETGIGAEHQTYLEVVMPQRGEGQVCFQKVGGGSLDVHLEVTHEQQQLAHAGREDISKLTRRVGEFLVEIKKTSLEYKEVLAQHNARQDRLRDYESRNTVVYVAKVAVMVAILAAQLWAVRKIFE